jgi:tetratricopeptide (TPR) repeat protein
MADDPCPPLRAENPIQQSFIRSPAEACDDQSISRHSPEASMRLHAQFLSLGASLTGLLLAASPSFADSVKPHCMAMDVTAQHQQDKATKAYMEATPPLWSNLGSLTYPITTRSTEAQHYFDQGLKLNVNFNHAEAQRAFRQAQKLDPGCAMCYFGEALVLGPNINLPMAPDANAPALAALRKAQSLASTASDKERALIAALALRYSDDQGAERAALDAAFADAMSLLADKYPDDLQIAVLASEAAMVTQPWDYWQPGGHEPKGRTARTLKLLEGVLATQPDHPGAIHLYIHLVEASDRPERAESHADRLASLMPGAGHIVHMPSHIYHRVGRHRDSLEANKAAAAVDEAYIAETGAVGVYPVGYYAHNLHFVLISAQALGDRQNVLAHADKLDRSLSNDVAAAIPMTQPIKAAPYFAYAQYAAPESILSLPDPAGAPPYVKAMWHYARGVAHAAMKDPALARAEAAAIERLGRESDWSAFDATAIPARAVLEVAKNVVLARAAQTEKDHASAVALFEKAVAAEDTLPYMEPPYWYYPVRQSLEEARLSLAAR